MKRLPIIVLTLALCLLTAGCGAKPNEPDDGDSAKAGIVERTSMPQRNTIASSPVKAWTIIRWRYTSPESLTHITHLTNTSFSLPDWIKTI